MLYGFEKNAVPMLGARFSQLRVISARSSKPTAADLESCGRASAEAKSAPVDPARFFRDTNLRRVRIHKCADRGRRCRTPTE